MIVNRDISDTCQEARDAILRLINNKTKMYKHQWIDMYSDAEWDYPHSFSAYPIDVKYALYTKEEKK